jgi:hypothetical protein
MPRKLVFSAWDEMFPDRKQRVFQPRTPFSHPFVEIPRISCHIGDLDCSESDDEALDRFARPLAERIRLEKLGLLHRVVPGQRLLERLDQLAAGPSNENAATFFL